MSPNNFLIRKNQFIKRQSYYYIETSQLIWRANQLTGFYMMATLAFNELTKINTSETSFSYQEQQKRNLLRSIRHTVLKRNLLFLFSSPSKFVAKFLF